MSESRRLGFQSVCKRYPGRVVALDQVDLEVESGERLAVVGPSAAGKSTLLRLAAGLDRPDSGSVSIGGRDVDRVPAWRRPVRVLLQDPALVPYWRVDRNVTFGARPGPSDRRLLETVGLGGLERRHPATLSGGQRQRVALARALRGEPSVLLLDEPFARLDPPSRLELRALLTRLVEERGITTVLVTHDPIEAIAFGQRLAVLVAGRLAQVAPPLEVYDRPATTQVAALLGDPAMNLVAPPAAAAPPPGAAMMGIRAERLHLRDGRAESRTVSVSGRIVHVEPRGEADLFRVECDGAAYWVRSPRSQRRPGDDVEVDFDPRDAVWFDAAGRRLEV